MFRFSMRRAVSRLHYQSNFFRFICTQNERKLQTFPSHNLRHFRQFSLKSMQLEKEYSNELDNLNAVYPEFRKLMIDKIPFAKAQERLAQILDYNVFREDTSHILLFLKLTEELSTKSKKQILNKAQIYTMGWILETFTMVGILIDDVADDSKYRSRKICWHRLENNANIVQNDLFMLYTTTNSILWEHFGKTSSYEQIFPLLNKLYTTASSAGILDYLTKNSKQNLNLDEYYTILAKSKGTFGFEMQIKMALCMNGYEEISFSPLLNRICGNLGYYQSLLNDYFDIEGNPYEIGKKHENIKGGDITWFFKEAKKILPTDQQKLLMENYGSNKEGSVEKILQMYEDADLMAKFDQHEEQIRRTLAEDINRLPVKTLQCHLQHVLYGFEKLKKHDSDMRQSFVWILF